MLTGSTAGSGLPVPPTAVPHRIQRCTRRRPRPGVDREITAARRPSTTMPTSGSGWSARSPTEGTYDIDHDGNISGYISPRLAFGHGSSVTAAADGLRRDLRLRHRRPRHRAVMGPTGQAKCHAEPGLRGSPIDAAPRGRPPTMPHRRRCGRCRAAARFFTPSDQGIRVEQLNTLPRCVIRAHSPMTRSRDTTPSNAGGYSTGPQCPRATHSS